MAVRINWDLLEPTRSVCCHPSYPCGGGKLERQIGKRGERGFGLPCNEKEGGFVGASSSLQLVLAEGGLCPRFARGFKKSRKSLRGWGGLRNGEEVEDAKGGAGVTKKMGNRRPD